MSAEQIARHIKLLALDVDGILSDGRIYYSSNGEEVKAFNIKDGLGIKLLQKDGIRVAIITGRQSDIVARRAAELGIENVVQGREDKAVALEQLCRQLGIELADCAYMGDDLPDLGAIRVAGLGLTVADGVDRVRANADWVSTANGGDGAVREACEFILRSRGSLAVLEADFD